MPAVGRLLADYDALVEAVRDRVDEMGLTRHELDHQAGMQEGYSAKILGPKRGKVFGMKSLGDTLGAIGCKLLLVEDEAQTARIRARMKPRQRPVRLPAQIATIPATFAAADQASASEGTV
jgi:hypothetical protein